MRDDRKEQGGPVEGDQVPTSAGFGERKFFEFASKKCSVLCILVKNYTCGQNPGSGGLIDPHGAEDVKSTGGLENLAGGIQPPTFHQLSPCLQNNKFTDLINTDSDTVEYY